MLYMCFVKSDVRENPMMMMFCLLVKLKNYIPPFLALVLSVKSVFVRLPITYGIVNDIFCPHGRTIKCTVGYFPSIDWGY